MENKYYTVKHIYKLTGISKTTIYQKLDNYGIKPDLVKKAANGRNLNYYLFQTICKYFDLSIIFSIPKKERKPYFEFSEITLKSKIHGTN